MFGWIKGGGSTAVVTREEPSRREDSAALNVVKRLARSISTVGKDAAEVRGALEDTQRVVQAQGQAMPFIRAAQQAAADISELLEDALRSGQINTADLFDEHYRPIEGTAPQQHMARFCQLTDRLFPNVQEKTLGFSDKVVFCIAADRNGYIATHNRKYCQPQRPGDTVWNTANSRYRRIFNDRTGLASARNTRPFLLQTYRRDMGGGRFVLLKEAAAPIVVGGRHWGGLRLAFNF